ncbi:MAG: metallophosphoesterase family protein [Actinobacteria bacterium]|nr:metallophosphoesterase family protein [Actinomycetota bacterium]
MGRLSADELARMSTAERHSVLRGVLSRRGLLRAAAVTGALGAGPVLLAPRAGAVSSGSVPLLARWLAFGEDPRTQVRVRWQVAGPVTGAAVRYGSDVGYGNDVPAALEVLRTVMPNGRVVEQYYAGADLGGLAPGTTYHYQVVHDGGVASNDATFRTAPEPQDRARFSFTAFGDQSVSAWAVSLEQVMLKFDPAFHLLAGDISYADASGRGEATDDYEPTRWDTYFRQIEPVAAQVPWMVAAGNHDIEMLYDGHGYGGLTTRFALPTNGPSGCPTAYTYTYGRVGFLVADSNDLTAELPANRDYSQGRQLLWVRERLAAMRSDPDVDFVVAVLHHCAYATAAAHGSDAGVRSTLGPLFDEFGVDLVISGHNHVYERTDPIRAGVAAVEAPAGSVVASADAGTTYICAGGGGMGLNGFAVADRNTMVRDVAPPEFDARLVAGNGALTTETVGWSRARYTGHSFIVVDVDPGPVAWSATMRVRMVTVDGAVLDDVTLTRDTASWVRRNGTNLLVAAGGVVGAGLAGAVLLGGRDEPVPEPAGPPAWTGPSPADRDAAARRRADVLAEATRAALAAEDLERSGAGALGRLPDPLLAGALALELLTADPASLPRGAGDGPDGASDDQLALDLVLPQPADDGPDETAGPDEVADHGQDGALPFDDDPPEPLPDVEDDVECFETDDSRYLDGGYLPWPFAGGAEPFEGPVDGPDALAAPPGAALTSARELPGQRRPEASSPRPPGSRPS